MKLSILLPTLFPDLARQSIGSILQARPPVELEIVVVAPFQVTGPNIVWVGEAESRGCNPAFNHAYARSSGDLILAWSDDVLAGPETFETAVDFFRQRESLFDPYCCALNYTAGDGRGRFGSIFGMYCPWFPLLRRTTIERLGGFYSTEFVGGWADGDLGLRVWQAGGRCEVSPLSRIRHIPGRDQLPESVHKYAHKEDDRRAFARKWAPIFGNGWDSTAQSNFNIDLPEEALVDYSYDYRLLRKRLSVSGPSR